MKVPELLAEPWAMASDTFEIFVECARRGMSMEQAKASSMGLSPEALTLLMSGQDGQDQLDVRSGGVAVIPVRGYLTRRSYWRGDRASYAWIGSQLEMALERGDVRRIVLEVDSPGGQVNGTEELAQLIFESRQEKTITAFVTGQASSAAYWIASAASRVVAGRTSLIGSIGVIWSFIDFSKYDEALGIQEINIVSSQSPDKNIDPATSDGRARIQATVDQLAGTFVADVARNRGVSEDKVISDFGRGWVLVGEAAVAAGLVNSIGRFEQAITDPDPETSSPGPQPASAGKEKNMDTVKLSEITAEWLQANCPDVITALREGFTPDADVTALRTELEAATGATDTARAEGATAERERILGIDAASEGVGHSEIVAECKADPDCTVEAAQVRLFQADRGQRAEGLDKLKGDEKELDAPSPDGEGEDDAAVQAANIKTAGDYVQSTGVLR